MFEVVLSDGDLGLRDKTYSRMHGHPTRWAQHDHATCRILLDRLETYARDGKVISYARLVDGVTFTLPVESGGSRRLDTSFLRSEDEAIIQDYARYIGAATYRDRRVLVNALLVQHQEGLPGESFFAWTRDVGLAEWSNVDYLRRDRWLEMLERVYAAYKR